MKKYLILCELILVLFVSSCFFKVETLIFKEGKYELVLYDPYEYPFCVYQDEIREFYIEDINIELIEISEEEFNDANGLNVIQNRVNKKFYNIFMNICFSGKKMQLYNFIGCEKRDDNPNCYNAWLEFDKNTKFIIGLDFEYVSYDDDYMRRDIRYATGFTVYFTDLTIDNELIAQSCGELP